MRKITIEEAIKAYESGFNVTYDGDKHVVMFGTKCNHCGGYFDDEGMELYCRECS